MAYQPKENEKHLLHVEVTEKNGVRLDKPQIEYYDPTYFENTISKIPGFVGNVLYNPDSKGNESTTGTTQVEQKQAPQVSDVELANPELTEITKLAKTDVTSAFIQFLQLISRDFEQPKEPVYLQPIDGVVGETDESNTDLPVDTAPSPITSAETTDTSVKSEDQQLAEAQQRYEELYGEKPGNRKLTTLLEAIREKESQENQG